MSESLMVGK